MRGWHQNRSTCGGHLPPIISRLTDHWNVRTTVPPYSLPAPATRRGAGNSITGKSSSFSMAEASRSRKALYWALFVIFLSVAVLRFMLATNEELTRLPDTPESAQPFICRQCGHAFSLTPRARVELMARGGRVVREEMTAVRRTLLPCPVCGAVEVVVARTCPVCRQPYVGTDRDGRQHAMCPECETAEARQPDADRSR